MKKQPAPIQSPLTGNWTIFTQYGPVAISEDAYGALISIVQRACEAGDAQADTSYEAETRDCPASSDDPWGISDFDAVALQLLEDYVAGDYTELIIGVDLIKSSLCAIADVDEGDEGDLGYHLRVRRRGYLTYTASMEGSIEAFFYRSEDDPGVPVETDDLSSLMEAL